MNGICNSSDLLEELEYQEYLEHLKEFERNGFKKEFPELGLTIRKLTPKECWRLMGFDDEDFEKAKDNLNKTLYNGKDKSNSQLYKQARKQYCSSCVREYI